MPFHDLAKRLPISTLVKFDQPAVVEGMIVQDDVHAHQRSGPKANRCDKKYLIRRGAQSAGLFHDHVFFHFGKAIARLGFDSDFFDGLDHRYLMKTFFALAAGIVSVWSAVGIAEARPVTTDLGIAHQDDATTKWFKDVKFGMFLHWGLYAVPAKGEWFMES